ncbi:MAG: T9SS type A sorting domain-containing protein [Phycisphaerae bacterium]|nr:T9SS type A sorting domain-containing protein [Saprospiraceae bacterium]
MTRLFTPFLFLAVLTSTAFAQTNQVVFSFDHKAGADSMVLNQTVFSIWNNKKVLLTRAEFYISEVEIHHPDSTMVPLTDQYLLVDAKNPTAEFDLGAWPVETAHGVTLHLGVPQSANHNDPAGYPANHQLAPQNPTMHWGWSAGYRFMAIEGKVDNNGDGVPETVFEFHNLFDELYRSLELTGMKEAQNGVLHLHFVLDYAQLFKNMVMTGTLIQHGKFASNIAMMNNAATQNFVTMVGTSTTHEVESNSLNIKVSPNPANSETMLEYTLSASGSLDLMLTNTLGQTVRNLSGISASGTVRLETASLSEGIYYYAFYKNGHLLARKSLMVKH